MKAIINNQSTGKPAMSPIRKLSLAAGIAYLLTFVSVPTLALYAPLRDGSYFAGKGNDFTVITGGLLEIVVGLSSIATAVLLYPMLRKQHPVLSVGLVTARVLEAGTIFTGVAFLLTAVTLQQQGAGAATMPVRETLVYLYDKIFLLGQSFIPAINDLLLGYMLYQSRLIPRSLAVIGMVGAAPLIAGYIAVQYGYIGLRSPLTGLSALLVAGFELSLGIYLIVRGLRYRTEKSPEKN